MARVGIMPSSENKGDARTQALARGLEPRAIIDLGMDYS